MVEIWKQTRFPRYEVSSLGRVRGPRGITVGTVNIHGYLRITITVSRKKETGEGRGKRIELKVHRLVCEAFHEKPEGKDDVNHIDGDKTNNREDNLEWCTRLENLVHCWHTLGRNNGREGHSLVMSIDDVQHIRSLYLEGVTASEISKITGRKYNTIVSIVKNQNWRHLPWPKLLV